MLENYEQPLLGACLTNHTALLVASSRLNYDDFQSLEHQVIWQTMQDYLADADNFDQTDLLMRVANKAANSGYIASLLSGHYSVSNLETYINNVLNASIMMQLSNVLVEYNSVINEKNPDDIATDKIAELQTKLLQLSTKATRKDKETDIYSIMKSLNEQMTEIEINPEAMYIPCGFEALDELIDGYRPGTFNVIGARPGVGKTALGLNITQNMVFNLKQKGLFISLEMSANDVLSRLISSFSSIPYKNILNAQLNDYEADRFAKCTKVFKEHSHLLNIVDENCDTIETLKLLVAKQMQLAPVRFVVVDYLGLLKSKTKTNSKYEEVSYISRELKMMAMQHKIVVICLAQLNRGSNQRMDNKVYMSDLRDSGSIEQDADTVLLIQKDKQEFVTNFNLAKNRRGETGEFELLFKGQYVKFVQEVSG